MKKKEAQATLALSGPARNKGARARSSGSMFASSRTCACGCGAKIPGRSSALAATAACRKRIQRARDKSDGLFRYHP